MPPRPQLVATTALAQPRWPSQATTDRSIADKSSRSTKTPPIMGTPTSTTLDQSSLPAPVVQGSEHISRRQALVNAVKRHWDDFKAHLGTGAALSSDSATNEAGEVKEGYKLDLLNTNSVDEIVVDRNWADDFKSSVSSEHGNEKSGSHPTHNTGGETDQMSVAEDGFWDSWAPLAMLRWRTWPIIMEIFSSRFVDEKAEWHFGQESWFLKKKLALVASLWLICNWVLGCIFIPHNPVSTIDTIFYFGIAPFLSIPVVFMVMYDWPRVRPYLYQGFLIVSVWFWSFIQIITIIACGYYSKTPHCQGKDFLTTFYYTTALQTIALFGLRLNRFPAALAALTFFLFASIAIIPKRTTWARTMINFFIFQAFLIYVHYVSESYERRLYNLRDQLKVQFKEKQKAQLNERSAWDSKRRLTSYVFHEVRVPLNTALLAVQNMEASGTIGKEQQLEFDALCGSLSMMSKVLNDVLDFNRLDSGKFELISAPYAFHQVMKSIFVPLELTTKARNLQFEVELDPNIDILARQASYSAMGESPEAIRRHIKESPEVDGIVLGDEVRLRQIITNLASNACKFTPAGGKLIVRTKLIIPHLPEGFDPLCDVTDSAEESCPCDAEEEHPGDDGSQSDDPEKQTRPLSKGYLTQHALEHGDRPSEHPGPLETLVIRIEVEDTGCGIKPRDIHVGKLFSDFNQTEQGRQQGGKGTGLGLALVRRIVKISGGRLGVRSKEGQGSTFWVELPVGVGKKTFVGDHPFTASAGSSTAASSQNGPTQRRSTTRLRPQDTGCDLLTVTDEPGSRGMSLKKVPQADAQTFAAMQGIMEQGGRVDLVLRQRSMSRHHDVAISNAKLVAPIPLPPHMMPPLELPSPTYDDPEPGSGHAALHSEIQRSASMGNPLQLPTHPESISKAHSADSRPPLPPTVPSDPISVASSGKTTPKQRPTFVQMPSPPTFDMSQPGPPPPDDPDPESSHSNTTSASDKSSSKLRLFDSTHAHNSPSSSFVGIEPGLPVLVVDDDPLTRTLMKRILTRLGCQVSTAENGEVALEQILGIQIKGTVTPNSFQSNNVPILEQAVVGPPIFDEGKFAVIFLDNQMPLMSGLQVAEKLREYERHDFIVGVTGNALLSDQEEYLAAGADRVLTKPVMEKSLRDILVIADERRKARLASELSASTPPDMSTPLAP